MVKGVKRDRGGGGGAERVAPEGVVPLEEEVPAVAFSTLGFRRKLQAWYVEHARELPWRGIHDPYATWLSEIMLQQTRVATVIDRYKAFLWRFPTIAALAAAQENDVLALWSGLGYYRRARMLHRGAQFVVREMGGKLPSKARELRTLPGVGEYTAAAIASIAFGESVPVLDGNVERVLLRVLGEPEQKSAQVRARLMDVAEQLVPAALKGKSAEGGGRQRIAPGDHNQAMMELGATICLPRAPLCLQCPVLEMCVTRGEHVTSERKKMQSRTVAHVLVLRKRGVNTEVLLERRAADASLMAGMLELPPLPLEATEGKEPVLRVRHAITTTNYYVRVFAEGSAEEGGTEEGGTGERTLREQIPASPEDLLWLETAKLGQQPLTGLARKILRRLNVMDGPQMSVG